MTEKIINRLHVGSLFFEKDLWSRLDMGPFRIALDKFMATCKKQAIVDLGTPAYGYGGMSQLETEITTIIAVDGILLVSLSLDEIESLCAAAERSAEKEGIDIEIVEEAQATLKGTTIEIPTIAIFTK